jgi:hypothetical protein
MSTDLYDRIVSQRSGLERILSKVPGYKGYKEATDRRNADRMIREHVVRALKEQMTRLVNVEKKLISGGGLSYASKTRSAKTNFQIFIDKVNTAAPGYSGFYDAKKVGSDELEKIYAFDAALLSYADKFSDAVDVLDKAAQTKEGMDTAVSDLENLAQEALAAYAMRDDVFIGLEK